jgi:hypothetical protein
MSDEAWEKELDGMIYRQFLNRSFLLGNLSFEDYMDGLSDSGVPVYQALEAWDNGQSFSDSFLMLH